MSNKTLWAEYIQPMVPIPTGLEPQGGLTTPIDCILFDVYGTLFISESGDISLARNRSRKTRKLDALVQKYAVDQPVDALLESFFSEIRSAHETLKQKGIPYPEIEVDKIWMRVLNTEDTARARAFALEFEFLINPVYPMPHVETLLRACLKRSVQMGIISNAQFFTPMLFDIFFESTLQQLGFHKDLIFLSYRFGWAKPARYLFEKAAARIQERGIPLANVLYVGNDMRNDIYPADAVGFKTALFAGDRRSLRLREDDPQCKNLAPDLILTDLIQLLDYL